MNHSKQDEGTLCETPVIPQTYIDALRLAADQAETVLKLDEASSTLTKAD